MEGSPNEMSLSSIYLFMHDFNSIYEGLVCTKGYGKRRKFKG